MWEGVYATFAEAAAEHTVFEDAVWVDKNVTYAEQAIARSTGGAIPPVAVTTDHALPFLAAATARPGQPLRILDFGGGMGTSYVSLRAMLPKELPVEFVVVENATLSGKGNALFADDPAVRFRADIPAPPARFDIVHFGSSIHYVDDWKGVLAAVAALQPEYIVFAELTAADNRSFVTAQQYRGRRIPVRFWNFDEFAGAVRALGFDVVLKARYRGYWLAPDAELPTSNFDDEHRLRYTSQVVFRRARVQE